MSGFLVKGLERAREREKEEFYIGEDACRAFEIPMICQIRNKI